jgi:hypothetical protein
VVDDLVTCGDGRVGQAGALGPHRIGRTWILTGRGRGRDLGSRFAPRIEALAAAIRRALGVRSPSAELIEATRLDRGALDLWARARPAMAAAVADALREVELLDLRAFTCPRCGMTSRNPDDVREGYCGACHDWTREVGTLADPDSPVSRWVRGEPLWGDRG